MAQNDDALQGEKIKTPDLIAEMTTHPDVMADVSNVLNDNLSLINTDGNNLSLSANADLDKQQVSSNLTYNSDLGINVTINGNLSNKKPLVNAVGENGFEVEGSGNSLSGTLSVDKTIELDGADLKLKGNLDVDKEGVSPSADVILETDSGVTADLHADKEDVSLSLTSKPLINPDNPNGNEYQEAKEALIESGDRIYVSSKFGYSNEEKTLYSVDSFVYRIDNDNFASGSGTWKEQGYVVGGKYDGKKVMVNYMYENINKEVGNVKAHSASFIGKFAKTMISADFGHEKESEPGGESVKNISFGTTIGYGRTEYGGFGSGFNCSVELDGVNTNGKTDGYNVRTDLAYNWYGQEHMDKTAGSENSEQQISSSNDYLVRSVFHCSQKNGQKSLSMSLDGGIRLNNCKTVFEVWASYSNKKGPEQNAEFTSTSLGWFQQVGKNIGDASIYLQAEYINSLGGEIPSHFGLYSGAKYKASDKITLDVENNWRNDTGWGGSIGVAYHF